MEVNSATTVRLLVVSQENALLSPLSSMGTANSWQIDRATSGWEAIEQLEAGVIPDLVMLDAQGDGDGLHFLRWLRRLCPYVPIILVCEPNDTPKKQEAIRLGARDCLSRPLDNQKIEAVLKRHLSAGGDPTEADITSDDVESIGCEAFFVGASLIMRKLRVQAESLAASDVPVLILGERGSGKRTIARLIHHLSVRSGFTLATVNCAALPGDLLENELFGSGGNGSEDAPSRPGKLKSCDNGTLLLREITEMPMTLQARLQQVLRSKRFPRPGNGAPVEINTRVLATSTSDPKHAISEGKLRDDLYYSLSAYTIHVPPLRERREEVPLLLHHFMRQLAKQYAHSPRGFPPAVVEACQSHSWPGNLREMETFVKRYIMAGTPEGALERATEPGHHDESDPPVSPSAEISLRPSAKGSSDSDSLKSMIKTLRLEAEKNAIAAALRTTGWNRKAAARLLKVSYRTLLYKIEQYQMTSHESDVPNGRRP